MQEECLRLAHDAVVMIDAVDKALSVVSGSSTGQSQGEIDPILTQFVDKFNKSTCNTSRRDGILSGTWLYSVLVSAYDTMTKLTNQTFVRRFWIQGAIDSELKKHASDLRHAYKAFQVCSLPDYLAPK